MYFHQVLIAAAIIKFKNSDDVLQGINKLDYLIKVSVFQQYKELPQGRQSFFNKSETFRSTLFSDLDRKDSVNSIQSSDFQNMLDNPVFQKSTVKDKKINSENQSFEYEKE